MNNTIKSIATALTSLVSYITGDQLPNMIQLQQQQQITFYLQCFAFVVTIIAGLFSIYFGIRRITKKAK